MTIHHLKLNAAYYDDSASGKGIPIKFICGSEAIKK